MRVLLVSNGHGEDAIAARLALELRGLEPSLELVAVPLVGRGTAYERSRVRVDGPRVEMPSGGFMLASPAALARDLRAGFARMSREQFRAVRAAQPDAVVVVGDVYGLWAAVRFARRPDGGRPRLVQVQPLVSAYYADGMTWRDRLGRLNRTTVDSFVLVERMLMRRAERVFARDERSAALLRSLGVERAEFVGNLMMDLVAEPELDLAGLLDGSPVVALLPGTREDHVFSLPLMLRTVERLEGVQALAVFGGELVGPRLPPGWSWVEPSAVERAATAARVAFGPAGRRVPVLRAAFAAVLRASSAVLGTSGTGNEQAAGLGVPVVGFPTGGPQYLPAFARAQRRLLGDALLLEPAEPGGLARALRRALADPGLRARAAAAGRERMGEPGGAARVARATLGRPGC